MNLRQYDKRKMQSGSLSIMLIAVCALFFAACESNDLLDDKSQVSDIVEISASIGDISSRVTQTSDNIYAFEKNDSVHVVGWYGGEWSDYPKPWEGYDSWWNDSKSVFNGIRWVSTPYMRWANLDDESIKHHFLAWWPEDFADSTDNLTTVTYKRDKVSEYDILVAHKSTQATPGVPVQMQFDHLMARFDVRIIEFKEHLDDMTDLTISIPNLQTDATINLLEKTMTASQTRQTVALDKLSSDMTWYSGILVPQTFTSFDLMVTHSNGKTETLQCNYEIRLTSGCRTTLRLKVGKDKIYIDAIEVTEWEISPEIDAGEAEEIK